MSLPTSDEIVDISEGGPVCRETCIAEDSMHVHVSDEKNASPRANPIGVLDRQRGGLRLAIPILGTGCMSSQKVHGWGKVSYIEMLFLGLIGLEGFGACSVRFLPL
jgi:hypothetical protein